MTPAFIEIVGSVAASLTTAAFFPQAIKTIRTGETSGLSLVMYLLLVAGVALWLAYGLLIGSRPLILANGIVLMPQAAILAMMLQRHWRNNAPLRDALPGRLRTTRAPLTISGLPANR